MVKKATRQELAEMYFAAGEEVEQHSSVGGRPLLLSPEEVKKRKASLIREDGQELLNGFDYIRSLPRSAFGYKPPIYQNHHTIPRVAIITTVLGSYRGSQESPLCIYLEEQECYVGYRGEEGCHSFGSPAETNFLARVRRERDGLWIESIMRAVMFESIKHGYSSRPKATKGAQPK